MFEQLMESIHRKHDQHQAEHDRIIKKQQKELNCFDRNAEQFGNQIEQFSEQAETWMEEDGWLPGVFK
ncbi:hypothetical protein [Bacillus glycinifermentans]|nr:hypothetical protein [Bacillus glycinifermentans]MEC0487528.1 hypothetical protein [Bacillus glycinifermentans]